MPFSEILGFAIFLRNGLVGTALGLYILAPLFTEAHNVNCLHSYHSYTRKGLFCPEDSSMLNNIESFQCMPYFRVAMAYDADNKGCVISQTDICVVASTHPNYEMSFFYLVEEFNAPCSFSHKMSLLAGAARRRLAEKLMLHVFAGSQLTPHAMLSLDAPFY